MKKRANCRHDIADLHFDVGARIFVLPLFRDNIGNSFLEFITIARTSFRNRVGLLKQNVDDLFVLISHLFFAPQQ